MTLMVEPPVPFAMSAFISDVAIDMPVAAVMLTSVLSEPVPSTSDVILALVIDTLVPLAAMFIAAEPSPLTNDVIEWPPRKVLPIVTPPEFEVI